MGVLGLQDHQKEEEALGEDHDPPCSQHAAAAAAVAAAVAALPTAGTEQVRGAL